MMGRRIMPDDEGWLPPDLRPGDYGHCSVALAKELESPCMSWWQMVCPDGSQGCLNPLRHDVVEHEDGTITVTPSIVSSSWHGWLNHGIWSLA